MKYKIVSSRLVMLLSGIIFILSSLAAVPTTAAASCYAWANQISLESAVNAYACVNVAAGTWSVPYQIIIPSGHSLNGVSAASTVIKAAGPWGFTGLEGVLQVNDPDGNTHINNITVDANHLAAYAIGYYGMVVNHSIIKNARCNGIGIVGKKVQVLNSTVVANGATCPSSPPGAGIYIEARDTSDKHLAPVITGNSIYSNTGPGIDVNGAYDGIVSYNKIYNNGSWAAVSLYGASNWSISVNNISQPASRITQPYQAYCNKSLPSGPGSAAIFLCQNTDANGLWTTGNNIAYNKASGYYGIASIGADEVHPYWAPRDNGFWSNDLNGSRVGCVDDFKPGQWGGSKNTWSANQCSGPNTGPIYF
jgi:parallel beta-helix repeat protein